MNIIGRLTADAQVNTLPSETQVVNFSVAVNNSYKNKQGEKIEETAFYDCSYWRTTKVAEYLKKGTLVQLSGWVTPRAWINSDGEPRAGLNLRTKEINFLSSTKNTTETTNGKAKAKKKAKAQPIEETEDDLPF